MYCKLSCKYLAAKNAMENSRVELKVGSRVKDFFGTMSLSNLSISVTIHEET